MKVSSTQTCSITIAFNKSSAQLLSMRSSHVNERTQYRLLSFEPAVTVFVYFHRKKPVAPAAKAAAALPPPDEKDEINEMQDLMSQYMPTNNTGQSFR